MKFRIIPNEKTPKVKKISDVNSFIALNLVMIKKFVSFANRQKKCAGLAANQCSLDGERLMLDCFAIKNNHRWDLILAPRIIKYNGAKKLLLEKCLTWLGKTISVYRFPEIEVLYYDLKGDKFNRTIDGFEAQVWQHEYNHLQGVEEKFV